MNFNELLRKTRLEHNVSIEELSKQVDASESTIQKYEEGTVMPDVVTLVKICRALNVTPNDLLLDVSFSSNWFKPRSSENFLCRENSVIDLRKMTQEEQIKFAKKAYDLEVSKLRMFGLTADEAKELLEKAKDME